MSTVKRINTKRINTKDRTALPALTFSPVIDKRARTELSRLPGNPSGKTASDLRHFAYADHIRAGAVMTAEMLSSKLDTGGAHARALHLIGAAAVVHSSIVPVWASIAGCGSWDQQAQRVEAFASDAIKAASIAAGGAKEKACKAYRERAKSHAIAWAASLPEVKAKRAKGYTLTFECPSSGRYSDGRYRFFWSEPSKVDADKPAPVVKSLSDLIERIGADKVAAQVQAAIKRQDIVASAKMLPRELIDAETADLRKKLADVTGERDRLVIKLADLKARATRASAKKVKSGRVAHASKRSSKSTRAAMAINA